MVAWQRICPRFISNDATRTEVYTLSLHDALPISKRSAVVCAALRTPVRRLGQTGRIGHDRPGTPCDLLTALAHSFNVANSASRACLMRWAPLPDVTADDSSERRCGWLQQSRATCADRRPTKHHLQPLPTAYRNGG